MSVGEQRSHLQFSGHYTKYLNAATDQSESSVQESCIMNAFSIRAKI